MFVLTSARCGKIQRESEFAANVDCGWLSWGVGLLLVKPLKWTFSTLLGSSRVPLEESFVVIELVKVCQTQCVKIVYQMYQVTVVLENCVHYILVPCVAQLTDAHPPGHPCDRKGNLIHMMLT